jgi:hypothetical protein
MKFNAKIKDRYDSTKNQIVYDWWVVPDFPEGERERMRGTSMSKKDAEESVKSAAEKYRASINPYIWEWEIEL